MSKPPNTQRKSRLLAALDGTDIYSATTPTPPPPQSQSALTPGYLGPSLLRAQTPLRQRLTTPAPNYDYTSLPGNRLERRKRKTPALDEDDYGYGEGSGYSPPRLTLGHGLMGRDFSLNYDKESVVRSIDRGGEDQAIRMAEFVSRGIDNAAHGLTTQRAMKKLGLANMKDYIPGMEVRLLAHQLIGVSWMVDQERDSPHKGGILADDMGLGKTVQMIATMVINQPTEEDKHHSTLIVVPAALLLQWKEELESKTNGMFDVHIQHGKDKIRDLDLLAEKDVIITTYHTLNQDFSIPSDIESEDELAWLKVNGGVMSRTRWYRVILDEAQFVRNRGTRSSKCVAMLRSKYRWCLTGTPITNTLADIYGFLRFGRFRPWNDWDSFNEHVAKMQLEDANVAGLRAQEILKPLLLRRTKNSELEGKPILELPAKDVELVYAEFSQDERDLYNQFEKRAQIQINRFIRNNTLLKNHQQILVLILRLRQVCTHPYLVLADSIGYHDPTAVIGSDTDKELARATNTTGAKWVKAVKQRFLERARAFEMSFDDDADEGQEPTCPKCGDLFLESNGRLLACGHEICADCIQDLAVADIEHDGIFGNNDEQTNLRIEKEFDTAVTKGLRPCPTCKKMADLRPKSVFMASAFLPSPDEVRAACRAVKRHPRPSSPTPAKKRKVEIIEISDTSSGEDSDDNLPDLSILLKSSPEGKEKDSKKMVVRDKANGKGRKVKDEMDSEDWSDSDSGFESPKKRNTKAKGRGKGQKDDRESSEPPAQDENMWEAWKQGGSNVESSAKMLKMIEYVKEWERCGDKTIVFSQWTSMLDLCEQIFSRHGIRCLRYDGGMSREAREYCLTQFKRTGGPKVVLVSIKCGGVGLNLVSANRVINLDLSWNYATESQAYDRVHRLGQTKEVFIKRLVIRDTIEERMLTLQETKLGLAGAALGEGTGVKLQKLSVRQIKTLFGMYRNNDNDQDRARRRVPGTE